MRRPLLAAVLLALLPAACAPVSEPAALASPEARTVFFTADSALLDAPAQGVIADAATVANRFPGVPVHVLGYAAPNSGSPRFNDALSEARARIVADELGARGVAPTRIRVEPQGATPIVAVPVEARRVEIRIGG